MSRQSQALRDRASELLSQGLAPRAVADALGIPPQRLSAWAGRYPNSNFAYCYHMAQGVGDTPIAPRPLAADIAALIPRALDELARIIISPSARDTANTILALQKAARARQL